MSIHLISDRAKARALYLVGLKAVVVLIAPVCLVLTAFAAPVLQLWLGSDYARIGAPLLQIFALGVFINSFNFVTLALAQAGGRPDWVPKLSLAELPIYLPALYWAIQQFGLMGAALVWLARIVIEFVFLLWASTRVLPEAASTIRRALPGLTLLIASFLPFFLSLSLLLTALLCGAWLLAWVLLCWTRLIAADERRWLLTRLRPQAATSGA